MGTETGSQFQALLRRAVDVAGQKQAAAKAIGVTPARFSKLFHNAPGSYTLGVRNCFRLAMLLGEPPQTVLRAVGKQDIAAALDDLAATPPRVASRVVTHVDPLVKTFAELLAKGADRAVAAAMVQTLRNVLKRNSEPTVAPPRARSR